MGLLGSSGPQLVLAEVGVWNLRVEPVSLVKTPVRGHRPELPERPQFESARTWQEIRRAERLQSVLAGVGLRFSPWASSTTRSSVRSKTALRSFCEA